MALDISKLVYGGAFVLGGVGVGYASGKLLPEDWKTVGYIAAFGLGIYGLYSIYQALSNGEGERPPSDLVFPMDITDPTPGEKWSVYLPHIIDVNVSNPYDKNYNLFAGCSLIKDSTGEVCDFPIVPFTIRANSLDQLHWWFGGSPCRLGLGLYWIVVSVWDIAPIPPCEEEGTCHRVGTAESNVEFTEFG